MTAAAIWDPWRAHAFVDHARGVETAVRRMTSSPILIVDAPAYLQLITIPLGGKVRFACSFNPLQHGGVGIEESKRRRARQDLHRSITVYLVAAGDTGQHDLDGEGHRTNLHTTKCDTMSRM